jgi:hypothetical protein
MVTMESGPYSPIRSRQRTGGAGGSAVIARADEIDGAGGIAPGVAGECWQATADSATSSSVMAAGERGVEGNGIGSSTGDDADVLRDQDGQCGALIE